MKTFLSAILPLSSLLLLAACGSEQFGTAASKDSSSANTVKSFEQSTCASYTLIKPKVDILYVVDNSTSSYYLASDIRTAIKNTVDSVSQQFDYRVIGMPLLGSDYSSYQVMTNSTDDLPEPSKKVISSSQFDFFTTGSTISGAAEPGLSRVSGFINSYASGSSTSLFRKNAYLLVVLISNGFDTNLEYVPYSNGAVAKTSNSDTLYNQYKTSLLNVKTNLALSQLRFFSVTAKSACNSGWYPSTNSYIKFAKDLYALSGATDSSVSDAYDLCSGGIGSIFSGVNNSIKQVLLPHTYRYWPMSFATNTNVRNDFGTISVYKISNNTSTLLPSSAWAYYENTAYATTPQQIEEPSTIRPVGRPSETFSGRHFVKFTDGNLITYPDCVQIKSSTRTEYFKYIVIQKDMSSSSATIVRINGTAIPNSAWTYRGNLNDTNIKADYPNSGDQYPAVTKSGFMIEITDANYYYKSGDTVDVSYTAGGI